MSAMLVAATPAVAHDWYPIECCHALDCAVVEKVEMTPAPGFSGLIGQPAYAAAIGEMVVTTKFGTVVVPANFPRRLSKDGQMHACMRKTGEGNMRLLCIFMPPAS